MTAAMTSTICERSEQHRLLAGDLFIVNWIFKYHSWSYSAILLIELDYSEADIFTRNWR